jgi:hypothetical protein
LSFDIDKAKEGIIPIMNDEQEEVLVAFLIVVATGVLIYFNAVVFDVLNAVPTIVSFCFLQLLAIFTTLLALPFYFLAALTQKFRRWRQEAKERRRKTKLAKLMKEEHDRKRDAPDMPTECPCCMETLFDSNGVAVDDMDIAIGLPCEVHLIHGECLRRAGQSLNADGRRYGRSLLGPRSGCPICGREVSFWTTTKKATDFGVFWWHKIQKCIEQVGRENGPVSVDMVMDTLRNDPSLTPEQKSLIIRAPSDEEYDEKKYVFEHALRRAASGIYSKTVTDDDGEWITGTAVWPPVWDYDRPQGTLWMKKWS